MLLSSNRIPEGAWLNGFSLERGKLLQVRGTSKSSETVSEYMRNLQAEPRLRDVRLVSANNAAIETNQVVQFSVSAFPVGNLPLIEFGKKKSK
jgi:Tfp pilus assembly protein PilN